MIYHGKDYPTENHDEYDDIVDKILSKAATDQEFPLHHAIATQLRAQAVEWYKKGYKKACLDNVKIISNYEKSWSFVMNSNIRQFCDVVVKKLMRM